MILVDTSVWIDFFAGKESRTCALLRAAIEDADDLCICGLVMTEVLQGLRSDKEFKRIHAILADLVYLPVTKELFVKSAEIYRKLRKQGKTVRSPVDCMIASVCLEHEIGLLHNDRDYDTIMQYFPLRIVK